MKKYTLIIIGLLAGVVLASIFFGGEKTQLGSLPYYQDSFVVATTNSTSSVGTLTGGSTVLSVNPSRSYARITNIGTTDVWCAIGTSVTTGTGIKLAASSTYEGSWVEFGRSHIPSIGQVQCISSATTTVSVVQN